MKNVLAIAALAIMIASCNTSYEKTPSGLAYKIFKGDGKRKLKAGDIIKFNISVKLTPKDTVWFSTYGKVPQYIPFDTSNKQTNDFTELLKFCAEGDSIVAITQIDSLVKKGMAQYSEILKKGDQVVTQVKIIKVFTKDEEVVQDQKIEMEIKKKSEVAELESYLKKKGIKAEKTENGVFVEMKNAGSGAQVVDGKQITVDYTGYLLENGKPFDSNVDSTIGKIQPFSFVVGRDPIISGWSEGLKKFGEGGSGTLYIPSMLAYGPRGSQPVIPPFAALKFDVVVKKIVDAPPVKPQPIPGANGEIKTNPPTGGKQ